MQRHKCRRAQPTLRGAVFAGARLLFPFVRRAQAATRARARCLLSVLKFAGVPSCCAALSNSSRAPEVVAWQTSAEAGRVGPGRLLSCAVACVLPSGRTGLAMCSKFAFACIPAMPRGWRVRLWLGCDASARLVLRHRRCLDPRRLAGPQLDCCCA